MSPIYVPGKVTLKKESVAADPYYNNVSLLLHGDGTNGSTTIVDSSPSPKTVTAVGDAQISTAQSKFGGASIAFDGTGDKLTVGENTALKLGTGDFCIELFANRIGAGTGDRFLVEHSNGSGYLLRWNRNDNLQFYIESVLICEYAFSFSIGQWFHIAATRSGSTVRLFVDGSEVASGTSSGNASRGTGITIAGLVASDFYHGYIDDLRITKGIARYTSNFTPPTAPFPEVLG